MTVKEKLTEAELVNATEAPVAAQPAQPAEVAQAQAQAAAAPAAEEQIVSTPTEAPIPAQDPLVPPAPGMIPSGWIRPEDLAAAIAMETGDVEAAGTAEDAQVSDVPVPEGAQEPVDEPMVQAPQEPIMESQEVCPVCGKDPCECDAKEMKEAKEEKCPIEEQNKAQEEAASALSSFGTATTAFVDEDIHVDEGNKCIVLTTSEAVNRDEISKKLEDAGFGIVSFFPGVSAEDAEKFETKIVVTKNEKEMGNLEYKDAEEKDDKMKESLEDAPEQVAVEDEKEDISNGAPDVTPVEAAPIQEAEEVCEDCDDVDELKEAKSSKSFGYALAKKKNELNKIASKEDLIAFVKATCEPEADDAEQEAYLSNMIQTLEKKPFVAGITYIYDIILKGEGMGSLDATKKYKEAVEDETSEADDDFVADSEAEAIFDDSDNFVADDSDDDFEDFDDADIRDEEAESIFGDPNEGAGETSLENIFKSVNNGEMDTATGAAEVMRTSADMLEDLFGEVDNEEEDDSELFNPMDDFDIDLIDDDSVYEDGEEDLTESVHRIPVSAPSKELRKEELPERDHLVAKVQEKVIYPAGISPAEDNLVEAYEATAAAKRRALAKFRESLRTSKAAPVANPRIREALNSGTRVTFKKDSNDEGSWENNRFSEKCEKLERLDYKSLLRSGFLG